MNLPQIRQRAAVYFTRPVVALLVKTGLSADSLTILGFVANVAAGWAVAAGHLMLGGGLVLFAGLFDLFDGALARAKGQASRFGALLDSTLDRLSEAAVLLGLLFFFARQSLLLPVILTGLTLTGSVVISYVRARAEGLGMQCKVGLLTRPERVVVLAIGLLFNWATISLWVLAILSYVTIAQRLLYLRQQASREK